MQLIFYIAALVAIGSTFMVITRTNAMHALLYLIVSLLSVAMIFLVLGAPFVAALEVIIYAGAIMVLFVFVVMLVHVDPEGIAMQENWLTPAMYIGPSLLAFILLAELAYILYSGDPDISVLVVGPSSAVPPNAVGASLFGRYLIGVELASLLLLSGMVGAFHLARHRTERSLTER
jgi:NADH-quinone oxidoreductase subunit J